MNAKLMEKRKNFPDWFAISEKEEKLLENK